MNVGQVLEVHLEFFGALRQRFRYISTPVFDGASENDVINLLDDCGYPKTVSSFERRSGSNDNPVTVGHTCSGPHHLVDDKIHARSTGPYR